MDRAIGHDLLANVSLLSPNETELGRLTGLPVAGEAAVVAAAEALVHSGVNKVLVKRGEKGSLLVGECLAVAVVVAGGGGGAGGWWWGGVGQRAGSTGEGVLGARGFLPL